MPPLASANPVMPALSRLGLGVTGPHATALVAPAATAAMVGAALEAGVTLFDTGPMYGDGEGERRLGTALAGVPRDTVFVSTKTRTFPMRGDDGLGADIGARMRRSLEESLARLRLTHVDALLLHGPRLADLPVALATLAGMKREGLVGAAGVCGRGVELEAAIEAGVDLLMMPLDAPRLARAQARGVPVIAIETMRGRAHAPRSAADLWYAARGLRDAVAGGAPPPGAGVAAALAMPAVRSVVVQTTRVAHLIENVAAASAAAV